MTQGTHVLFDSLNLLAADTRGGLSAEMKRAAAQVAGAHAADPSARQAFNAYMEKIEAPRAGKKTPGGPGM